MKEVERPVLRYFGGKWILAPWIIEHFPPHKIYVEPFGGAASVLMRTRSAKHGYNFEMTDSQHEELCEFIQGLKGMVILCGYENPIYEGLGWARAARAARADGARERTEMLWMNPAAYAAQAQTEFKLDSSTKSADQSSVKTFYRPNKI